MSTFSKPSEPTFDKFVKVSTTERFVLNSLNASGAKLTRACVPRTVKRQFRGNVGSDGFVKVLIGTRGAREAFLDGAERASGEEQRSDERRKTA